MLNGRAQQLYALTHGGGGGGGGGCDHVIVDEIGVTLDLASGDQTVVVPNGASTKKAVITKPAALSPENIREGVNVAGVVGTLEDNPSYNILEDVSVALDLADGNQTFVAPEGYLVASGIIEKPATLLPENIAKDVDIAGVVGTYEGAFELLEDMSIAVNFSGGDQIIFAPDGYAVKRATIKKPTNLLPENIVKDVDIAGVVGTYEGGGGAGEGCVTVTFMDRGEVLFTRPVYIGDDCPNPVTQGRIEAPTKDSTESTVYTYSGWAVYDGGSADDTALSNITADKTVYAAYTSAVRYYTVTFYDGTTLLHTEQVAYGGSSSYEYEKQGYVFNGWTPEPTNITSDLACYGEWEESLEIQDSWDTIIASANDGTYSTKYKVGMYKPIDFGTYGVINMQIVAFDSDDKTAYTKAPISWLAKELFTEQVAFYPMSATSAKFSNSNLCAWLNNTIKPLIPENIRNNIKPVNKIVYYNNDGNIGNYTEQHELWIPSTAEIGLMQSNESGRKRYTAVYPNNESRVKYLAGTTTKAYWWTLTPYLKDPYPKMVVVRSTGEAYTISNPENSYGVCLGFCI